MYRRKGTEVKPPQVQFPVDLKKLGLFIDGNDQLRQIQNPDAAFDYFAKTNAPGNVKAAHERLCERRREAVDECIRRIVVERLENLGMRKLLLPFGANVGEPHVEIMISEDLDDCDKVLVLSPDGDGGQLGIWSSRSLMSLGGTIDGGSMVGIVKQALEKGYGIVILNPSQSIWDPESKTPMNFTTWRSIKSGSAVSLNVNSNSIPSNGSPEEHVEYVFVNLLDEITRDGKKIDIIATGMAAHAIICFLNANWSGWKSRVYAIALAESAHTVSDITNADFSRFLLNRVRNYIVHNARRELVILDQRFGCAVYSSCTAWAGNIIPECVDLFMDYLEDAHVHPDHCNPPISIINGEILDKNEWMDVENADPTNSLNLW